MANPLSNVEGDPAGAVVSDAVPAATATGTTAGRAPEIILEDGRVTTSVVATAIPANAETTMGAAAEENDPSGLDTEAAAPANPFSGDS